MAYLTDTEIGARIARLIEQRGRSQADVAASIEMDAGALGEVICGRRVLTGSELVLIAGQLQVSPQSLISKDAEPVFTVHGASDPVLENVMNECERLIDGYLLLEALVPNP